MKSSQYITSLRGKSFADLEALLRESDEQIRVARLDLLTGKSKNGASLRLMRANRARIHTVMTDAPRA